MNYTIIGDTVNVASRLGQRARAGEMLFSDAVKHRSTSTASSVGALPLPRWCCAAARRRSTSSAFPRSRVSTSGPPDGAKLATAARDARYIRGHVSLARTLVCFSIYRPRPVPGVGRRGRALRSASARFLQSSTSRSPDRLNRSGGSFSSAALARRLEPNCHRCVMTTQLLDSQAYGRLLALRDLTDAALGPHAMQLLVQQALDALRALELSRRRVPLAARGSVHRQL